MNERCKEALYHSWGKAPERKVLEKEYNADYYKKNKNRWVVNREKRKAQSVPTSQTPSSSGQILGSSTSVTDYARAPLDYYDGIGDFNAYALEGAKDAISAGKKFVNALKIPFRVAKKAVTAAKNATENLLGVIGGSRIVSILKGLKGKEKYYTSQSRIKL